MTKKIYLDIIGKKHSLYNNLIDFPPEGYNFFLWGNWQDDITAKLYKINLFYEFQKNLLNQFIPINFFKAYLEKSKTPPDDRVLTYSSGHPVFRREPWIVDLEFVTHLCGYNRYHFNLYKKTLEKLLESDYCKKIMPWTNAGTKTVLNSFDSKNICDKVETVHLAVPTKNFTKTRNTDKIRLLFVGSQNIPKDFEIKGGKEVLKSFEILNKKYDNLELVIRSYVPKKLKRKYLKFNNICIYDRVVSWAKLENLFKTSDIFLFPSHNTPGLIFLDAMSYELPIITTDVWANHEMIKDGKNGFLIKESEKIQYHDENLIPNWSEPESLKKIKRIVDQEVVNDLVKKTSILIEDEKLRRKMGKAGRQEIEDGRFSIKRRNEKLKKVFDKSIEEHGSNR